jgi:hypothetical protein
VVPIRLLVSHDFNFEFFFFRTATGIVRTMTPLALDGWKKRCASSQKLPSKMSGIDRKYIALGLLTAAAAVGYYFYSTSNTSKMSSTDSETMNTAYVFIKPHANNAKTQELVAKTLAEKGIKVLQEGEFTGEQIDAGMHIDQHYYAIASKATILKPAQIPVPAAKFEDKFGLSWETALADGLVYNAMDACKFLGVDADGLDALWNGADKVKFGGGFYCGSIEVEGKPKIYAFNGFFMSMRSKFVTPGTSIHYYVVEFNPKDLAWSDFRGKGTHRLARLPIFYFSIFVFSSFFFVFVRFTHLLLLLPSFFLLYYCCRHSAWPYRPQGGS